LPGGLGGVDSDVVAMADGEQVARAKKQGRIMMFSPRR
jgi:hypothetical protein